jgi:hypothetical protein
MSDLLYCTYSTHCMQCTGTAHPALCQKGHTRAEGKRYNPLHFYCIFRNSTKERTGAYSTSKKCGQSVFLLCNYKGICAPLLYLRHHKLSSLKKGPFQGPVAQLCGTGSGTPFIQSSSLYPVSFFFYACYLLPAVLIRYLSGKV